MAPRVLILGGGFAGLETAFTLRHRLRDKVRIDLVSDREDFVFKPNTIYLPFGGLESKLHIGLRRPLSRRDIGFHPGDARDIDADRRVVHTSTGERLGYDFLVAATGAAMRPQEIPGLAENAQMIWTPRQMRLLGGRLAALRDAASRRFATPPGEANTATCSSWYRRTTSAPVPCTRSCSCWRPGCGATRSATG